MSNSQFFRTGAKLSPVFLYIALFAGSLFGQITGTLRGTVTDASGGGVPNATITLTNLETKVVRTQTVNAAGEFNFELLPIGNYEVKAEARGFNAVQAQAMVNTGEVASVALRVEVGNVTQVVEVQGAVAIIDTENSQIQHSVVGQAIQELPVGRSANNFALTSPGVAPVTSNNPYLGNGSFNSNGGRGRGNNIMVDGITATDVSVTGTGGALGPLNFSSIKEVQIITNNFSAEYGRNSSAQVLYITKGGTNELHGELYEYLQNDKMNARGFFDRTGSASIIRENQYGFEVGGPVFIPKAVDFRNKLFWHFDFEQVKIRGVGQPVIANVPKPGALATITDPTSAALAKQYGWQTDPSGTIAQSAPNTTNTYQYAPRADWVIGKSDTLWARFSQFDSVANSTGNTFITTNLLGFGASSTNHPRQATLAETHLFGARAVNEFRFGFGQSKPGFPIQTPYALGPQINFADGSLSSLGVANNLPQGREQRTFQYTDNFSYAYRTHNLKTGFEWYHLDADSFFDSNFRSTITFANFAAFAAGQPTSITQNFGNSVRDNRVENRFWFFQDDWKVMRNLTLNLGVRLEFAGGPTEANGKISNLNLNNQTAYGIAGAGPLGLLEAGKPSFNDNYNWAPRFGFAWQPFGNLKTVVRGGYGISYDFVFLNPITNQRFLPPFIYSGSLTGVSSFTGGNSYANFVAGTATLQQQLNASVGSLSTTLKNFGAISPAIAQNLANSQVQQWSFGIERELANNLVVKASYVGTKGTHLTRTRPINLDLSLPAPATSAADEAARYTQFTSAFAGGSGGPTAFSNREDPRYNAVNYLESSANSIYNSLQVEVQKRLSKHYFATLSYTYSHSIDDSSDPLGVLVNDTFAQQNPFDNRNNRASSQFDLRHVVAISHTVELPFFLDSKSTLLRTVLGGWAFAGISTFRTGFPVNLYAGSTPAALGNLADVNAALGTGNNITRPNVAGPIHGFVAEASGSAVPAGTTIVNGIPTSVYAASLGLSQPFLGNYGTLGRNVLRLGGQVNFDWELYKNFHLNDKINFQLRGEYYNLFNMHALQGSSSNTPQIITSSTFGQFTNVSQNARTGQVAARIIF